MNCKLFQELPQIKDIKYINKIQKSINKTLFKDIKYINKLQKTINKNINHFQHHETINNIIVNDEPQKTINKNINHFQHHETINNIIVNDEPQKIYISDGTKTGPQRNEYKIDTNKFKILKAWGVNWLKNTTEKGGAQTELNLIKKDHEILIVSETKKNGRLWSLVTGETLQKLVINNNGVYEIATSYPRKVYFDIDKKIIEKPLDGGTAYLNDILGKLKTFFSFACFSVSGSCAQVDNNFKLSYHVIINNYIIRNRQENEILKTFVTYLNKNICEGFDINVYKDRGQNFKCINQAKRDGREQKIIIDDHDKNHFITYGFNEYSYILPNFETIEIKELAEAMHDKKVLRRLDYGKLPQMTLKIDDKNFNLDNAEPFELLQMLPISKDYGHEYTHKICRFCFSNGLTFENFLSWYRAKNNTDEAFNKWAIHWENMPNFPAYNISYVKSLILFYYPQIKKNLRLQKREKKLNDLIKQFENRPDNVDIINIDKIDQSHYKHMIDKTNNETFMNESKLNPGNIKDYLTHYEKETTKKYKYTVFNVGMGAGKTEQTIKHLNNNCDNFLWITPNIALSDNTATRLNENLKNQARGCKHYKTDFKSASDKKKMDKEDRLIICLNSIHHLKTKNYDTIVIDEIETFLKIWFNNKTLNITGGECWQVFKRLIKNAKNIILLDAFTSNLTLNFINNIKNEDDNILLYERVQEQSNIKIEYIQYVTKWEKQILDALQANKKIFIYYPFKNGTKGGNYMSMEAFKNILEAQTKKKIIIYNGDVDDVINATLKTVNETWSDYDAVITNNKITVGVNYDNVDDDNDILKKLSFDLVFVSLAPFSSPRDVLQASRRCREVKEKIIKVTHFNTFTINDNYERENEKFNNCQIMDKLANDIIIEKRAPIFETFKYFCLLGGYLVINDDVELKNDVNEQIKQIFDGSDGYYSYDDINDIETEKEIDEIKLRTYKNESTTDDKLRLSKHYFKQLFYKDANKDAVAEIWDGRQNFFFERLRLLLLDEDKQNIINQILQFNDLTILELSNFINNGPKTYKNTQKNIKLNVSLIDKIFNSFHFSTITKTTTEKIIFKNVINTYFNTDVIKSETDTAKHTRNYIDEQYENFFIWGANWLNITKRNYNDDQFIDDYNDKETDEKIFKTNMKKLNDCLDDILTDEDN